MKITKVLLAASLTLGLGVAHAQPSKFQGAFGQLGVGYESVSPTHDSSTLSVNRVSIPVSTSSSNANSMIGTFALGYYHDVAKGFLLGVGAEYSPFAGSGATMSVSTTNALPGQNNITNDYRYQKKDSYNIFISPAVLVGADGMAYAKIGYTGAKVANYNTLNYNFTGYSLGLGYKQFFSGNWYGFVEANYADYGSQTESATNPLSPGRTLTASGTNSLTTYNGVVGIGYKF
jgi:outer membrane immunogenic protein